jgi:diguanylate cyclase (GGDEF)-like protein
MQADGSLLGSGLTILVVDDEPVIRQLLEVVLTDAGFRVEVFATLREARARSMRRDFDVVVADKNLPDGSGLELCRELREAEVDCKLIVMSGYANLASAVEAIQHGVADYFVKPLDLQDLLARLSRVVELLRLSRGNRMLIAQLRDKNTELEALAVRDPLTRLFNHAALQDALQREVARSERYGHRFVLTLIDIDRFRELNERHGHAIGDSVLRELAALLSNRSRKSDLPFRITDQMVAARYGEDVFAMILPESDRASAATKLEAVRRSVREQLFHPELLVPITITVGLACYPEDATDRDALIEAASRSLQAGKRVGGDQLVSYTPALGADQNDGASRTAARAKALGRSLAHGSFRFLYQPIVNVRDGSLFAYEALCRPTDSGFENVVQLIETAVHTGRIRDLGRVLRRIVVEPMPQLPEPCALFVNIHPQDLNDEQLLGAEAYLLPWASRVVLEVTETEAIRDYPRARARIAALREQGFRIALDDLGSGYSSLNLLAQLEPDIVKLDMELVRGIEREGRTRRLVQHLIEFCRGEGFVTVAEGIETDAELAVVTELGVDLVQGYLLAHPQPPFCRLSWPAKVA